MLSKNSTTAKVRVTIAEPPVEFQVGSNAELVVLGKRFGMNDTFVHPDGPALRELEMQGYGTVIDDDARDRYNGPEGDWVREHPDYAEDGSESHLRFFSADGAPRDVTEHRTHLAQLYQEFGVSADESHANQPISVLRKQFEGTSEASEES